MLSRVWKERAPGPFVDPFNDFTSWNDGRFLAERGTPDRFAYPPNTSTQLSRDSSSLVSRKKKNPTLPLFLFFRPPEFLRSLRKEYATRNYRRFRGKRKKRRLNRGNVTREWFFENEKFVARFTKKITNESIFPRIHPSRISRQW